MIQEVRIYKQFDTDLIALCTAGYPVARMIRDALTRFAHGIPAKYDIPPAQYFDMNGKRSVRMRISISDEKAVHVLKNIKHGYRNSFCKCILRNALPSPNPAIFFADETMFAEYQTAVPTATSVQTVSVVPQLVPLQPFPGVMVPSMQVPKPQAVQTIPAISEPAKLESSPAQESVPVSASVPPLPSNELFTTVVSAGTMLPASHKPETETEPDIADDDSILEMFDNL